MSISSYGSTTANNRSLTPVFSSDAQTLLFQSWASDLFPQDFNQGSDLFAFSLYTLSSDPTFTVKIIPPATLSWPIVSGKTYQVQFKNNLTDPYWQIVNGNVSLSDGQGQISDLAPASNQRFYRVIAY